MALGRQPLVDPWIHHLEIIAVNLLAPVQPHIQVAAEKLIEEPILHLGPLGNLYLTNTLTATVLLDIIILVIACWYALPP